MSRAKVAATCRMERRSAKERRVSRFAQLYAVVSAPQFSRTRFATRVGNGWEALRRFAPTGPGEWFCPEPVLSYPRAADLQTTTGRREVQAHSGRSLQRLERARLVR